MISNQRERILDATMRVVADKGYAAMRVEDVIVASGVSRRTFYDHFSNKEDVFLAAYDAVAVQLTAAVQAAFGTADSWPSKITNGIAALLAGFAMEPALAQICIVDVLAAGPSALERRRRAMARFRAFMSPAPQEISGTGAANSPLLAEAVVGGVYEIIHARVVAGRTHELPELLGDVVHAILLPFVGPDVADAQRASIELRRVGAVAPPTRRIAS